MRDKALFILQSILLGMVGGLITVICLQKMIVPPKRVVKVDVTKLVDNFVNNAINQNIPKEKLTEETKHFAKSLESKLQMLADQNRLVVLPSQAVIYGADDYTDWVAHEF